MDFKRVSQVFLSIVVGLIVLFRYWWLLLAIILFFVSYLYKEKALKDDGLVERKNSKKTLWLITILAVMILGELGVYATSKLDNRFMMIINKKTEKSLADSANEMKLNKQQTEKDAIEKKEQETEKKLLDSWRNYGEQQSPIIDIAVFDQQKGKSYHYTNQEEQPLSNTASVIKISVLSALLHKIQEENIELTNLQKDNVERMIKSSDNNATTYLIKNALDETYSVQSLFDTLQMTQSTFGQKWGYSTTTAQDQIMLLKNIFMPSDYLNEQSQQYIQELMLQVDEEQAWGVGAGSSQVALKNGWLLDENDCIINSVGQVINGDKKYLIAVFTNHDATMNEGVRIIENLTKMTTDILFQQTI